MQWAVSTRTPKSSTDYLSVCVWRAAAAAAANMNKSFEFVFFVYRSTHQIANDISLSSIFRLCDCLSLCIVYIGRVAHAIGFVLFLSFLEK